MFDICIIGHLARDVRRPPDGPETTAPGGVAHYAGVALARLGADTAVIAKAARSEAEDLAAGLRAAGAQVFLRDSAATTMYENIYSGARLERRRQNVWSLGDPFGPDDLGEVRAGIYHLGPLIRDEMPPAFLRAVAARGARVSLDVQGFVRRVEENAVRPADWPEQRDGLALVDIVKANRFEAGILTGEDDPERAARALAGLGPAEVIVTLGAEGSVVLAGGRLTRVPALPPERIVDPTGCGDSFCAGYLCRRLGGDDPATAARFAAAVAAIKLERAGPFAGSAADVRARMC
jgi:sugar/nucleoside kinase (ribokinase family)